MERSWKPPQWHPPAGALRASDADRERIVTLLREAYGDGRLTVDEHAERVQRAYEARTLGELAALTADLLPAEQQPIQIDGRPLLALFSTVRRGGRWVVPVSVPVTALFGTVEVDMREALLQRRHVVVRVAMFGGRLRLTVPEGVRVEFTGRCVLGARGLRLRSGMTAADAPVVEVSGLVVLGSVSARTPGRRLRDRIPRRGTR